jgi:hypothetical protein
MLRREIILSFSLSYTDSCAEDIIWSLPHVSDAFKLLAMFAVLNPNYVACFAKKKKKKGRACKIRFHSCKT